MFLSAYLAIVLSQRPPEGFAPENTADRVAFSLQLKGRGWSFDWADAEDRVRGTVTPRELAAGEPFTVSVAVGPFAGGEFDGPVSLGLEQEGGAFRALETVQPSGSAQRTWNATFTPPEPGTYVLKVAFRSSRQKSLKGPVEIGMGRVSQTTGVAVGIGAILLGLVYGLFVLFGKKTGVSSEAQGPPPPA